MNRSGKPSVHRPVVLRLDSGDLDRYRTSLGLTDRTAALGALARAIAASPSWRDLPPVVLAGRAEPEPALGIFGELGASDLHRLEVLTAELRRAYPTLLYLDHAAVEAHVETLASRLRAELGAAETVRLSYTAIPRGGLVVLGLLAYALGLPRRRLETAFASAGVSGGAADAPVVVVDDCALSGLRFAATLERLAPRRVVFAHLLSSPHLRRAVVACERQVIACVAAADLADRFPVAAEAGADEVAAARARWHERLPGRRYWTGELETPAFPWGEPDRVAWDARAGRVESGWRLLPPDLCLAHRGADAAGAAGTVRVQLEPPQTDPHAGRLQLADPVLWAELGDERVAVARVDGGEGLDLQGEAAVFWRLLIATGDEAAAAAELASRYDCPPQRLRADLDTFAGELIARGLLRRHDDDAPPV